MKDYLIKELEIRIDDYLNNNLGSPTTVLLHPLALQILESMLGNLQVTTSTEIAFNEVVVF